MDIQEKQARWALEKPLFEAEFIQSHLLPFFNFNENTGDYEIKSEFSEDEDKELAFEVLNTGWVMWLRAKRAKAQAVPYESCSIKSHKIIINETKNELIDGYDIAKEDEYLLESLVYRGVCIGEAQAVPEKDAVINKLSDQLYAQEMKTSAARVLCETACELLDDYAHQDAMVILNDLEQAMKEPAND